MARVIFGDKVCATNCFPEAPDVGGCGPICCEPVSCCEIQPCKTRLRDAMRMKPNEIEREFKLTEFGCDTATIPVFISKIGMTLRKRAGCHTIACITPIRTTVDSTVVFRWPDEFLSSPPGQYEGDVFINDCEVGSVLLIKPDQKVSITSGAVTECEPDCMDGACADPCGGCHKPSCQSCSPCGGYAEPDGEADEHNSDTTDCGVCESC